MKPGRSDDLSARSQIAPSLSGATHVGEPILEATLAPDSQPLPFPDQRRDPDRYRFLGEHGRGGLGRVSRVHDRELGRDVAIKELLSRDEIHEARFLREALITARLEHPGIVPMYEAGRWPDGTPFYAMKMVSGRSLRTLISERATVEQRLDLLHHVIAVADAIAYAHGRNIIHRDLKPSNVIVGEFGETIVIDWGLAKDLTSSEASIGGGASIGGSGSSGSDGGDDLTSTGSILGTPAYMAPEQRRGESVDQRADVFAIGMMLWELCAIRKLPPVSAHVRHRMLRSAGIDGDLATILDKCLEPDPRLRYADAGALATDLKAFKSGARIAARSYSLFAMLAHWTRRHRALALSAAAVLAIAVTGCLLFVRGIAVERDRADSSEVVAKRARASAEASLDELTLNHARLLLTSDPSAALDALATYHGRDLRRADQIRAEAMGRGVAFVRAVPHTDSVLWAGASTGGAIISLSNDGAISRTSLDGTSIVLTRGVSKSGLSSYSPSRHLLAYSCDPSDVCLFDVARAERVPAASRLPGENVIGITFSPDGGLLGLMSRGGGVNVFDVTDPGRPVLRIVKTIADGMDIEFIGNDVLVAGSMAGVEFIHLDGRLERFSLPDISRWATRGGEHKLALATAKGQALLVESFPLRVAARVDLCHGPIANLRFIPGRQSIAYACRQGSIGIWDLQRGTVTPRIQLEGHADLIAASPAGDYVIAAGSNGTVAVLDLYSDLVASYKGHGFRLSSITPPTAEHPFLISADTRGAVRAWALPARFARVAATAGESFQTAIFDGQSTRVTATTWQPALTTFSPATGVRLVAPHELYNVFLAGSTTGSAFATYGARDVVEVWSSATMTRTRVITTGHGSVSQLGFVGDTDDFITSGHDGRLIRWAASGQQTLLAQLDQPIDRFAIAAATGAVMFSAVDGALWRTDENGRPLSLRSGGSRVNRILTLPDQRTVYAGYANGDVVSIDTQSWQQEIILHGSGAVRDIAITGDGHTIAVALHDGQIHLGTRDDGVANPGRTTWVTLAVRARYIALAPDGLLLASCTDGMIWMYSPARQRWICLPTGAVDLGRTAVAADGKTAVVLDFEGRLLWVDLEAARKLLDVPGQHPPRINKDSES